jgi:FkbM family methyltransferase
MSGVHHRRRSFWARIRSRAWRTVLGDRVFVPTPTTDPMWHFEQGRHRIRGGEMIVRFDNLDADIALDARSDLAARAIGEGNYEPELVAMIPALIGVGDAINIGANVGVVAIVMRRSMRQGSRLLCVEPIEECIGRLSRNLDRAGASHGVVVHRAFATDKPAESQEMWTVPGRPEYSSGGRLVHRSVATAEHLTTVVPAVRIDDIVAAEAIRPTCIVMDCEGGEYNALRGASQTLTAWQPTIVMEFDPPLLQANGASASAFLDFLSGLGYRCITLNDPPSEAMATFAGTVVATPASRTDAVMSVIRSVFARSGGPA